MEFLSALKERIPDYAKDVRLNLDAVIARSSLDKADALGAALAAAYAARSKTIVDAIRNSSELDETDTQAALSAAALMVGWRTRASSVLFALVFLGQVLENGVMGVADEVYIQIDVELIREAPKTSTN
mgnify:CR=1 FL=1